MKNFLLSATALMLCISCSQSTSNQVETKATLVDVIRNFNKYKDVERLFEGFDDIIRSPDTLTLFNFEQETLTLRKISCQSINSCYEDMGFTNETIRGDFQGYGWKDIVRIEYQDTDTVVNTTLLFSDKKTPDLELCGYYYIKIEGDLDGDGGDEIGVLEAWSANQCSQKYMLFTLKDNKWQILMDDVTVIEAMMEAGVHPVQKSSKQEGVILVRSATIGDCPKPPYIVEKCIRLYTPSESHKMTDDEIEAALNDDLDSTIGKSFNDIRFGNWTSKDWYDNDYFRFLRKCFNDCLKGVESENTIDLQDYKSVLNSKFFIYNAQPYIGGGMFIILGFLDNPEKVYKTAIYSDVDVDKEIITGYRLFGFSEDDEPSDITKEEVLQLIKEHPENKLW